MTEPYQISKQTARRFVLGRQGLWPGRRWKGKEGVVQAIRECECVQLDPLNVCARSQDFFLHSRVLDYRLDHLYQVMYEDRQFFDYGGSLFVYPMHEMPYWRLHMSRRAENPHWYAVRHVTPQILDFVRAELAARGPLANRDFTGPRTLNSYRGGKESALALYYLWLTGEVMIHHRVGFDRVYDFRTNILPKELDYAASEQESKDYFAKKSVSFTGFARLTGWKNSLNDYLQVSLTAPDAQALLDSRIAAGEYAEVRVTGNKNRYFVLAQDLPLLEILEQGGIPSSWTPLETTTEQEVAILAPLDIVSARGRAAQLFDFEYLWEVYKPVHLRRWGYYNVPVLYGDRLAARLDPRFDRKTGTLNILGFWADDPELAKDSLFRAALTRGIERLAGLVSAVDINMGPV